MYTQTISRQQPRRQKMGYAELLKQLKLSHEIFDALTQLQMSMEIAEIHPANKMMVRVWEAKVESLRAELQTQVGNLRTEIKAL